MSENENHINGVWIDPDDAPELDEDYFEEADFYIGKTLIRKGRPRSENPKISLTVRYDVDIIEAFRATGDGWQSRMNAALKQWLQEHPLSIPQLP
jgi:uncharacterized protein (DUF4415 family)